MPKITTLPFNVKSISLSVERDAKRSPGIHLSSIIKDMLITAGVGRKTQGKPFTPEQQHLIFERGFLWERMVHEYINSEEWLRMEIEQSAGRHLAAGVLESDDILVRPGECQLDGIFMTPDALNMKEYWIEEWKSTGLRAKGFDIQERRQEWLWQACSYANIFGMTKAVFRIWHVSDGIINSVLVEWTPDEVRDNWRRIMEHWAFMKDRNGQIHRATSGRHSRI